MSFFSFRSLLFAQAKGKGRHLHFPSLPSPYSSFQEVGEEKKEKVEMGNGGGALRFGC